MNLLSCHCTSFLQFLKNDFVNIAKQFPKLEKMHLLNLNAKITPDLYMELVQLCRIQKRKITIKLLLIPWMVESYPLHQINYATDSVEVIYEN